MARKGRLTASKQMATHRGRSTGRSGRLVGFFIWFAHRNRESTDDAYTDGNVMTMVSKISGYEVALQGEDNMRVKKGSLLVRIDSRGYLAAQALAALQLAQAQLKSARDRRVGRLPVHRHNIGRDLRRAQAAEATVQYRKTILNALQEIEDALTALHENAQRTQSLGEAAAADQRPFDVQFDAYRHGLISYITVVTVQLQAMRARQQLTHSTLTQSTNLVKLYKALGGGCQDAPKVDSSTSAD